MLRIAFVALSFAAAASAAVAMPSFQATPAPVPSGSEAGAAAVTSDRDPMKVVCRAMRPPTGTRLQARGRERVCQTQADWEAQAIEAQGAARDAIDGAKVNNKEFLGPGGISPEQVGPR